MLCAILVIGMFLPIGSRTMIAVLANGDGTVLTVLRATLVAATVVALWLLFRWLWVPLAILAAVTVVTSLWPPLVVASYMVGITFRRPAHLALYVAAGSVVTLLPQVLGATLGGRDWSQLVPATGGIALFVLLPLATGLWIGTRRELVAELRWQAENVTARHAAEVREVRASERTRIAHEMHDVVAHRVSLMVLHAGVLEVNTKEEKTAETAALIRTTGREALAQLRDVLGVLRIGAAAEPTRQPPSTLDKIGELVADSRAAGIPVRWNDEAVLPQVSPMVAQTAYQVVREALTNVHKHAGAVETEVELEEVDQAIEVRVSNAVPVEEPEPLPGLGLGLLGLQERVRLVGGTLLLGARAGGGLMLTARLPYAEKEAW
ncbi:sensor histidine kinase [Amycolatopsis sp. YIM 10]|uniref:sensor histidine kinase n=1 Tax=Amycolatopsis sp. YIM 10 TaxID=2653857 RepID=UPI0012AA81B1|nr:histidine kinase [Amycolatopsis sp. YIM 10]QFU88565.1 Sensor histidine kinase DesK [Amycolatopsis sp. YIM 10]